MSDAPYDVLADARTRHDTITRPPFKPAYVTKLACACGYQTDWFLSDNVILAENEMRAHDNSCPFRR